MRGPIRLGVEPLGPPRLHGAEAVGSAPLKFFAARAAEFFMNIGEELRKAKEALAALRALQGEIQRLGQDLAEVLASN